MDKIEIIGVNNFIGFHLAISFLEIGIEVIGYKLPIEEDYYPLKNNELARNANFQLKEIDEYYSIEKTIIDLYGLNNKENILKTIRNHIDETTLILVDEMMDGKEENQLIHLPKIFGRFDYLKEEEKMKNRDIYIGVNELCDFLTNKIDTNQPINMQTFQPKQVEKEWQERMNWWIRVKK